MKVATKAKEKLITGEELYEMGDIGPCELVEGRIVRMSPTKSEHSTIEAELLLHLGTFVKKHQLGKVMVGEIGIYTQRNPDTVRGADLIFISKERWQKTTPDSFLDIAPELAVEIISPTDRWQDLRKKIEEYFAIGINWVWIVEPPTRSILVFTASTEFTQYDEAQTLKGEGILKGFELKVSELFAEVR